MDTPLFSSGVMIIFFAIFAIVIGGFIFIAIRGLGQWTKNNKQQIFSDPVLVKDKRTHVWGGGHHSRSHTSYYITFEFENGERQEFMVPGRVYGDTGQGDTGTLTYQGTRFHDFQRVRL